MFTHSKEKIKIIIKQLIYEVLNEDDRTVIASTDNITLTPPETFEIYLKKPANIGYRFGVDGFEKKEANAVKNPFKITDYEFHYNSTENQADDGKIEKINKTTVIKKVKVGSVYAYRAFVLLEPATKPVTKPEDKTKKAEPINITVYTSDSFINKDNKGDPKLFADFLKKLDSPEN
jgi:hypothetical protein